MKYQTTPLFPIPLFLAKIDVLDSAKIKWLESMEMPPEAYAHDHTADKYILNQPRLAKLKAQIQEACNVFVKDELKVTDEVEFVLENSWLNRHTQGQHSVSHWHSNAMISGVYYIQTNDTSGDIVFNKSHLYTNLFTDTVRVSYSDTSMYTTSEFFITPEPGDVVMFPSHLEHRVLENDSNMPRYSLAFNFFARGTVGGGTSELKI
ncbi:TIGR02466 family protein [bacterium]|nr:2OG-Fe(II) oxygenase family protein [bacterium]MDC1007098.1 TIGR02466 family protein [bacterium]